MLTTSPVALAAAVRAEPARWRDVPTVAQLWARAFARRDPRHSLRARRLHVLARYPRSLALAVLLRRRTVLLRCEPPVGRAAACLTLHRPSPASSPLLLLAMFAGVIVVGGLDVALGVLGPMPLAVIVAVLLIAGRTSLRRVVRALRGRGLAVPHPPADIEIANVAAHPRGGTLGTHLMDRLVGVLDSGQLIAQLEARSVRAAAWYADLGFLSAPRYPHSLHMYRPPLRTTQQPSRPGPIGLARAASAPASSPRSSGRSGARSTAASPQQRSGRDSSPGGALP